MHYVRFLKPPSVKRPSKDSKDLQLITKITITSDLGESFLCIDLPILVILLDVTEKHFQSHLCHWKAGNRQLEISFRLCPTVQDVQGMIKSAFKVLIQPQADTYRPDTLTDMLKPTFRDENVPGFVLPVLSEPLSGSASTVKSRKAQRLLETANGEALYIWEETGESIARHIWDAGLLLSAYLEGLCEADETPVIRSLPILQNLLSKEKLRILELGAGCGIVGLTMGKLFPNTSVLLTDLPEAEDIAKRNIIANGLHLEKSAVNSARIEYQNLDWENSRSGLKRHGNFDLVLVADCTYNPDFIPHLVNTLAGVHQHNRDAVTLLAMKVRHDSEMVFFDLMTKRHLIVADKLVLPLPVLGQEAEQIEVYLFRSDLKAFGHELQHQDT